MAACRWKRTLYPSDLFVEACGAIVFDGPITTVPAAAAEPRKVCLLYYVAKDEWLLPKGRRNCNETRPAAAAREVREETGHAVRFPPLRLATRAPAASEPPDVRDVARAYDGLAAEPFMLDVRDLGDGEGGGEEGGGGGGGIKLVWWFVACLEGDAAAAEGEGEDQFRAVFVECGVAVEMLTFQKDRDILERAIALVEGQDG
ncbi:NUDIX domain-containing protein [Biscogniauxia marginata]|nr:NUDIX domain-containing protein [Biscogniauxia marginata]